MNCSNDKKNRNRYSHNDEFSKEKIWLCHNLVKYSDKTNAKSVANKDLV